MVKSPRFIIPLILIVGSLLVGGLARASGVTTIIQQDSPETGSQSISVIPPQNDDFGETFDPDSNMSQYVNDPTPPTEYARPIDQYTPESFNEFIQNDSTSNVDMDSFAGSFVKITSDIRQLKSQVTANAGQPMAVGLAFLLYSLAAFIQMARVISGKGDWISFIVRVLLVYLFIEAYPWLFGGAEAYAYQIEKSILGGESASEILFSLNGQIYEKLSNGEGVSMVFDAVMALVNILTSIFSLSVSLMFNLLQACVLIALSYLGPLVIALSIIPETDFSESLIASVIQVLSWMVMYALLVRIVQASVQIYVYGDVTFREFILLSVLNVTLGLTTLVIPLISNLVFSGKNWGALGMAGIAMIHHGILGMTGASDRKEKRYLRDQVKDKQGENPKGNSGANQGQVLERQGAIRAEKGPQNAPKTQGFDAKNRAFDHPMVKG